MTKPTLVLLAAGMGSRYGGLKQLDAIGPNGETIIDYSIYDAIRSGFGKVVFVIRDHFQEAFEQKVAAKFRPHIAIAYAYQPVNLPKYEVAQRQKPWGTGHAVLVSEEVVQEPFAVANADDFYGYHSFQQMAKFLQQDVSEYHYAMVGFELSKTLSTNGTVSRGVCEVTANGKLMRVEERTRIALDGKKIIDTSTNDVVTLSPNIPVSMNLWGFHPSFFSVLNDHFYTFVENNLNNPKAEYYIPLIVNELLQQNKIALTVLPTNSQWFGVTYQADKPDVQSKINELISFGEYPSPLFN